MGGTEQPSVVDVSRGQSRPLRMGLSHRALYCSRRNAREKGASRGKINLVRGKAEILFTFCAKIVSHCTQFGVKIPLILDRSARPRDEGGVRGLRVPSAARADLRRGPSVRGRQALTIGIGGRDPLGSDTNGGSRLSFAFFRSWPPRRLFNHEVGRDRHGPGAKPWPPFQGFHTVSRRSGGGTTRLNRGRWGRSDRPGRRKCRGPNQASSGPWGCSSGLPRCRKCRTTWALVAPPSREPDGAIRRDNPSTI
jgi:hypothetical protein